MLRRDFLASLSAAALAPSLVSALQAEPAPAPHRPRKLVLRSSWQMVNIGDIAHTPGMLTLLEKHLPDTAVTLWPSGKLTEEVAAILRGRFPKLVLAQSAAEQQAALEACDFFLHGSGPGMVGAKDAERARKAGKPYGFAGITLSDDEIKNQRELLAGAKFVFNRDTDSLKALKASGIVGPRMEFGPDATFALDIRDEPAAKALLEKHGLEDGKFLCAVPRLRWTPYWEIHPGRKPIPERVAVNEKFAEIDHAKIREAIAAWVREVKQRVFLTPEMTYAVPLLRPLLFDKLPADVKPHVAIMDRYWLTAEAASVYARAAAVVSMEQHSPIIAVAAGVPAVLVRQPTDTRKGQMWRDIGLNDWLFEVDDSTGAQIAAKVVEVGKNLPSAREKTAKAKAFADERMAVMVGAIST